MQLLAQDEIELEGFASDCMELQLTIEPQAARQFGLKLLCSPQGEEETVIRYDIQAQEFVIDFEKASEDKGLVYAWALRY